MSSSAIGRLNADGTVSVITCKGGELDGTGKRLEENYKDSRKIDQLIALGDHNLVGREIGEKHDYYSHNSHKNYDQCRAFGRDRGESEESTGAQDCLSVKDYVESFRHQSYYYLWKDEGWVVSDGELIDGSYVFMSIDDALLKAQELE